MYMWWLQDVPGITLFLCNTKQYNHLSYVFFRIVLFGKYTLLSPTVNVLETFLKAILRKLTVPASHS